MIYKNLFIAFLCTNSEIEKVKYTIPLKIASKRKKKRNLGINLTKEVKDLYAENYKTLIQETR